MVFAWVGCFASKAYLTERIGAGDEDATPLNSFATDFRLGLPSTYFYKHNVQKAEFRGPAPLPIEALLEGFLTPPRAATL